MYTLANMQDSIKKVEATRAQRMATEPRRMTADEKDALLAAYHPDYKEEGFITLKSARTKVRSSDRARLSAGVQQPYPRC